MKQNTAFIITAVVLTVTLPYWAALPVWVDFWPAAMVLATLFILLEVLLMTALMMIVILGRLRVLIGAAAIALLLGAVPGIGALPLAQFLPIWLKLTITPIVLGLMINSGSRAWKSFTIASFVIVPFMLLIAVQGGLLEAMKGEGLHTLIESMVIQPLVTSGYNTETINNFVDQVLLLAKLFLRLLPGLYLLFGVAQLIAAFLLTELYFTRRDSYFPGFGPFTYWKIPERLLYLLGVVIIIRLVVGGGWEIAADNLILILSVCYSICGLAVIEHFLRRLRLPVLVRVVFYMGLTFMTLPGLLATSIAGLFDSYFDFRKVRAHTLG